MTPGLALSVSAFVFSAWIRPLMPPVRRIEAKSDRRVAQFADRPVEIDVGDLPDAAIVAHQVVDVDRLAVRLDDLAGDDRAAGRWALAGNLQPLAGIVVEAFGIDRRDIALEACVPAGAAPSLRLAHSGPTASRVMNGMSKARGPPAPVGHSGRWPQRRSVASSRAACHRGCAPCPNRRLRQRSGGAAPPARNPERSRRGGVRPDRLVERVMGIPVLRRIGLETKLNGDYLSASRAVQAHN